MLRGNFYFATCDDMRPIIVEDDFFPKLNLK